MNILEVMIATVVMMAVLFGFPKRVHTLVTAEGTFGARKCPMTLGPNRLWAPTGDVRH